jgi:hypothetical protein
MPPHRVVAVVSTVWFEFGNEWFGFRNGGGVA